MKHRSLKNRTVEVMKTENKKRLSPIEMIKIHGGKAHKVAGTAGREADSMLAVYRDRFTYTFIMNNEVASIHFDRNKGKIFFSGHNIQNMNLGDGHLKSLKSLISILETDPEGIELKSSYEATLGGLLADNK